MKETSEKHSELDFDFLSWRKANGYVGSFINIPLRNPKLTLSISTFFIESRKRQRRFRLYEKRCSSTNHIPRTPCEQQKLEECYRIKREINAEFKTTREYGDYLRAQSAKWKKLGWKYRSVPPRRVDNPREEQETERA